MFLCLINEATKNRENCSESGNPLKRTDNKNVYDQPYSQTNKQNFVVGLLGILGRGLPQTPEYQIILG